MKGTRGVVLAFSLALASSAISVAMPYLLLYFKGFLKPSSKLPAQLVVVDLGLLSTAFMLSRTLASSLSHYFKPRFAGITLVVSIAGMLLSNNVYQLLPFRVLQGFSLGLIWPHIETTVAKSKRGSSNLALLNMFTNFGFSAGNLVGGFLITPVDPRTVKLPFGLALVTTLSVLPLLFDLKPKGESSSTHAAMKYLYFSALFSGIALGMRVSTLPTYVIQYVTASPKMYSIAMAIPGLTVLFITYVIARRTDFLSVERKLSVSAQLKAVQALATSLIGFTRDYALLIALLMLSRLSATASVSVSKAAQGEMGASVKHFGFRQTMFGLGNSIGPIIGSLLYAFLERVGVGGGYVFLISALMNLASSYSLWKSVKAVKGE